MECNEAKPCIDASIDGQLSREQTLRLEAHLQSCAACRRERDSLLAVSGAVQRAEYHRAPSALHARMAVALQPSGAQAAAPARPRQAGWRDALGGLRGLGGDWFGSRGFARPAAAARAHIGGTLGVALAAVALAVSLTVAVMVSLAPRHAANAEPFVDELVASHVRAQLSGHNIDVVSSDQHTVKPWFNGKLDYAPPVEDLAANGFALAGGRLDYIDHRRVAVLVYRYRLHVVEVYVLPQGSARPVDAPSPAFARDGYALSHWRAHGMAWWAITDAEPDTLAQFETALSTRLGQQASE
ncbi:anti-sigma factor [Trinickia sp. LjRoot230]|uniref:anti-sigma factor family protein n=1 Tax=Trinickia sp. LjRoot230 TaxID=3342288 RepID=UPI003ECD23AB